MSPSMFFLRQSMVDVNQCLTCHRKDQIRGTIGGDTFPLVQIDYITRNGGQPDIFCVEITCIRITSC